MSEPVPPLVDGFSSARVTALLAAAALVLVHLRLIDTSKPLPVIGIDLPDREISETAFALVAVYSMVRLLIEWYQSDKARRRLAAARIDLALGLLLPGGVLGWYFGSQFDYAAIQALPLLPASVLVLTGLLTGQLASLWLGSLPLIRSREEALQLGLHRLPFALRAQGRMTAWWLLAVVFVVCLAPAFRQPLNELWPWLVGLPAMLGPLGLLVEFGGHMYPGNGKKVSLMEHFKELRKIFDWHDAVYQINGWDRRAPHQPSPLMRACTDGDEETVRRLVRVGADLERPEHLGWTPLMMSVAQQHDGVSRFLLENGANPNVANVMGRSPLSFAARYGNEPLVTLLMEYGALPNAVSEKFKEPPLHVAAQFGHRAIVELLLHAGADPTLRDLHKRSALEYAEAAGHGEIAGLLRRVGN